MKQVLFLLLLSAQIGFGQNFTGKIHYTVSTFDQNGTHASVDTSGLIEFVCDTALRVDQKTKIGIQTMLYYLKRDEAILLMTYSGNNFAVKLPNDTSSVIALDYKYKCKKIKIDGIKCKTAIKKNSEPEVKIIVTNAIPSELSNKFPGLKGYPVNYSLNTPDGSQLFEARKFEKANLTAETFSIPSGYRQITLAEFYELMSH